MVCSVYELNQNCLFYILFSLWAGAIVGAFLVSNPRVNNDDDDDDDDNNENDNNDNDDNNENDDNNNNDDATIQRIIDMLSDGDNENNKDNNNDCDFAPEIKKKAKFLSTHWFHTYRNGRYAPLARMFGDLKARDIRTLCDYEPEDQQRILGKRDLFKFTLFQREFPTLFEKHC